MLLTHTEHADELEHAKENHLLILEDIKENSDKIQAALMESKNKIKSLSPHIVSLATLCRDIKSITS